MSEGARSSAAPAASAVAGPGTSETRVPDLNLAGSALEELRKLWPFEEDTVYVGLGYGGTQAHVGFIRDRSRKATRISGPTIAEAYRRAVVWTRNNPTRVMVEKDEAKAKPKGGAQ